MQLHNWFKLICMCSYSEDWFHSVPFTTNQHSHEFVRHFANMIYHQKDKVKQKDQTNKQDGVRSQRSKYNKMFQKMECNYITKSLDFINVSVGHWKLQNSIRNISVFSSFSWDVGWLFFNQNFHIEGLVSTIIFFLFQKDIYTSSTKFQIAFCHHLQESDVCMSYLVN